MSSKRIIFFIGAYETLDLFTKEMAAEFEKCGNEIMIYDVRDSAGSLGKLAAFAAKKVDFAIGYNNLGFNMELAPGHNIWDDLQVTFINVLMDHPFHYREALINAPVRSIVLCCDRNHVSYINRFHKNIMLSDYMPHGGNDFAKGKSWNEREIDVFYAGGLSRDLVGQIMPVCEKYDKFDGKAMIEQVYAELVANPDLLTEDVIEKYLVEHGVAFDDDELSAIITDFRVVDSFATSYYREKVIDTLVKNGVRVLVCGRGWEQCECFNNPNFTYGGFIPAGEVFDVMGNTKIVLNTMTWFKDGSHDRVFNGQLAGAVSVTDYSKYISEVVESGKNGVIFSLKEVDKLPEIIKGLLENRELSEKLAQTGYDDAKENHKMSNRAHFIMERYF